MAFTASACIPGPTLPCVCCPAPPGTGLVFRDTANGQEIPRAGGECCPIRPAARGWRRTGSKVQTVEHVLSALAGLGVDDAVIEIAGGEVPAADGSAARLSR